MQSYRKIPYPAAFPMYYSLYNWIGEREITKLRNINICFEPENGTTQDALFDIFSNAHA